MAYITCILLNRKAKYLLLLFFFTLSGIAILPLTALEVQEPFSEKVSIVPVELVVAQDVLVKKIPKKVAMVAIKRVEVPNETHLKIERIGVDAVVKEMGVTPDGSMAVPANNIDTGWFSLGTRPGNTGSAVIGGHNSWDGKEAVFANLNQLQKGDVLSVVDMNNVSTSFVVRDIRTYDAKDENSGIFKSESGIHLNLITCSGDWDSTTKSSTKRLVIFTDIVQPINELAVAPTPIL